MWLSDLKAFFFETPVTAIALIFGILGVILTIRQNIFCWPAALISVVAATIDFYRSALYGDMALQIFYFFAGIYGWIYWNKRKNEVFKIKRMDFKQAPILLMASLVQFSIYYFLLIRFNGARPFLDALLTAASLTTTYMMTKKWVENWLVWVIIDSAYILLYALTDLWAYAFLYLFFAVIAYYGWIKWRKAVL